MLSFIKDTRLKGTAAIAIITTVAVGMLFPQQLGVLLFKANVLTCAAIAGYFLDRAFSRMLAPANKNPNQHGCYEGRP